MPFFSKFSSDFSNFYQIRVGPGKKSNFYKISRTFLTLRLLQNKDRNEQLLPPPYVGWAGTVPATSCYCFSVSAWHVTNVETREQSPKVHDRGAGRDWESTSLRCQMDLKLSVIFSFHNLSEISEWLRFTAIFVAFRRAGFSNFYFRVSVYRLFPRAPTQRTRTQHTGPDR